MLGARKIKRPEKVNSLFREKACQEREIKSAAKRGDLRAMEDIVVRLDDIDNQLWHLGVR